MNFPTEKKPADSPNEQLSPREMVERALNSVIMEMMQLRRTLWLVCQQTGPVTVDESQTHPLWRLKATREPDGKTKLEAAQLPDPTPEQIKEVVEILHGTKTPLTDALEKTELRDHPPMYIHMLITSQLIQTADGYWVDAALAKIAMTQPPPGN
jgi:hypothetical protein